MSAAMSSLRDDTKASRRSTAASTSARVAVAGGGRGAKICSGIAPPKAECIPVSGSQHDMAYEVGSVCDLRGRDLCADVRAPKVSPW